MAISTMEELAGKLSPDKKDSLIFLVDAVEKVKAKLDIGECSKEVAEGIAKKLEKYVELETHIKKIAKAKHFSTETQVNVTENILKDFDKSELLGMLNPEIESTKKTLKKKIFDIAKYIEQELKENVTYVEKYFSDNMALTKEAEKEAREEEEKLKRQEKAKEELEAKRQERNKKKRRINKLEKEWGKLEEKEQALIENNRYLSFLETFKRLWKRRNDKPDKKQNFFSVLKSSYSEYSWNMVDWDKKKVKKEVREIYDRQCEINDKIKKYEKEYESLSKQLKAMKKRLLDQGKVCLEDTRKAYDNSIRSIELKDVTEERVESVTRKVAAMSCRLEGRGVEAQKPYTRDSSRGRREENCLTK